MYRYGIDTLHKEYPIAILYRKRVVHYYSFTKLGAGTDA